MAVKATVGKSVGSRIGRFVGQPAFDGCVDQDFQQRLLKVNSEGMTRDEVSIRVASGHLDHLDGRIFDIDEAKAYIRNVSIRVDRLREPMLDREVIEQTIWRQPIDQVLTRFAQLNRNILIIGDKRLTFLYTKHEMNNYTTGLSTANYKW